MAAPSLSGKTLPAGFAASYIKVMVDLLGRHGSDAVLRRSGLAAWIGQTESTLAGEALDFALASALLAGLEETLGRRGARGLARRMGAASFERVLRPMGVVAAMRDAGFQAFPVERRLRAGLYGLARTLGSMTTTAMTTREEGGRLLFELDPCPDCWGRQASGPDCAMTAGLLGAAAAWIAPEAEFHIEEDACRASGAQGCRFLVLLDAA